MERQHATVQTRPGVQRAIAFIDCCGFSAYTARHGDEAAVALHLRLRVRLEHEAAVAGVDVVKWMGDGAMLAGPNVRSVLACIYRLMVVARAVDDLPLRAGITLGPVMCVGADYLGMTVNQAARRCARAEPWQVRTGGQADGVRFMLRP